MFHGGGWWGFLSAEKNQPKITWGLIQRVLRYGAPYRVRISVVLLLILLGTGLNLISPLILRDLIDRTIPSGDVKRLALLGTALMLVPLFGAGMAVIQRRLNAQIGEGVIFDLRVALYSHLQRMSLRFFTHTKVGELMSRLNNDVIGAQNAVSNTLVGIITNVIQVIALAAVLLALEWRLTLVSLVVLPLLLVAARQIGERLRNISRAQMDANAKMNAMMNETLNISGALLVKLFGRTHQEVQRFQERSAEVRDLGVRRTVVGTTFFAIIGLISAAGTALVYGLGGYLVIAGAFSIGTIVAFGAYLATLYGALQGLANAPVEFAQSMVSFERVFEVIDLPLEIADQPEAVEVKNVSGNIEFVDVSFKYETNEKNLLSEVQRHGMQSITAALSGDMPVQRKASPHEEGENGASRSQARPSALEEVSFRAAPGQLVALVGPSGAGKTTLTYLIPRLYDPSSGHILLDGRDLRQLTLASLSDQIGMVTQETHLFHDTIRTNLLYARLDASQSDLEAACQAANIHDFIRDLPDGYDTIVGERGYRLSGGEKQRLALARVILKNPRILVLDEATSHLDSESEALIQDALKRVMAGRTSIVIAHRLSTILAADLILVMDRGRIVERGTHAELLEIGGLYASLYHTQFSREQTTA
jgi:ATP-binding cassette subfamily B protein